MCFSHRRPRVRTSRPPRSTSSSRPRRSWFSTPTSRWAREILTTDLVGQQNTSFWEFTMHYLLRTRNATCPCPSVPLLSESFCSNVRPSVPTSLGRFDCTIYEQNGYAINNLLRQFREKFRACPKQSPPRPPPLAWLPSFSKSSNQTILHSPILFLFLPTKELETPPGSGERESPPGVAHNHFSSQNCLVKWMMLIWSWISEIRTRGIKTE